MKAELVLVPCAARGHLPAALELAKHLVSRSNDLSITVLLIMLNLDPEVIAYNDSLVASFASDRIKFVDVSLNAATDTTETSAIVRHDRVYESHKSRVRSAVVSAEGTARPGLAGLVLDMGCLSLADVARELGVPTYVFWPASAGCLGLYDHLETERAKISLEAEYRVPGITNAVPGRVLPGALFNHSAKVMLGWAKKIRESRGVLMNTSPEIEPHALHALFSSSGDKGPSPPVYAAGPILHLQENGETTALSDSSEATMVWLDQQPPGSVLFLCFGSAGANFHVDQLREIAIALESAGIRFLWSLRKFGSDPGKILPEGFLERTSGRGRVVGWAPQAEVLGHVATRGFVSHCGWNSVLESLWHGVPVATWPVTAEQQLNAFLMVVELGLAVEVKMDYRCGDDVALISAEVIEAAIGKVMEGESEVSKRVKEMSVKCRNAVVPGGSSFSSLDRFLSDVFENHNFK